MLRPRFAFALAAALLIAPGTTLATPPAPATAQAGPLPAQAGPLPAVDGCTAESEPNDTPEAAPAMNGAVCLSGTLPSGDQDLFLWELTTGEAARPWTVSVTGSPGTLTGLKLLPITSEPGITPITAGGPILGVDSRPETVGPVTAADLLLPPGRYVLGISRSGTEGGGEPIDETWTFSIAPGSALPASADVEPNDVSDEGSPLSGAFSASGDLSGSTDYYRWTVPEAGPDAAWTLRSRGVVADAGYLTLLRSDGTTLSTASADRLGIAVLDDLVLPAGDYAVAVSGPTDGSRPYRLDATSATLAGDPEPNDEPDGAVPLDPARPPARGRLGRPGDRDVYRLSVSEADAGVLRDIKLIWRSGLSRQLCLQTMVERTDLQCREGVDGVALRGLSLPATDYAIVVRGEPDRPADPGYVLRVDGTTAPAADYETEPNDTGMLASPFDPALVMRGLGADGDTDLFRLAVSGEPQLYQVDATGSDLGRLAWIKPDGTVLQEGSLAGPPGSTSGDRTSGLLTDMYLGPGDHWLRVDASGDYGLRVTPLGPPDPNAEREPNDNASFAGPYRLSRERMVGRLPSANDADVFRISLAGRERLTFRLEPPDDGVVDLRVESGGERIGSRRGGPPGTPLEYQLLLGPGDYEVWLTPATPSTGRYTLALERGDPFASLDDEEPNDDADHASILPASLRAGGAGDASGEYDWFRLPPIPDGSVVSVDIDGPLNSAWLSLDGDVQLPGQLDDETGELVSDPVVAAGGTVYLVVSATGPYALDVRADGLVAAPVVGTLPVRLELAVAADEVAAFWPGGQRIEGTLTIANDGSAEQALSLDALTSHFAWIARPAQAGVSLPAGASITVPVEIRARADAWADEPVRISIRARDAAGAQATTVAVITPRRDAEPVAPERSWPVPDALLGGLDVASLALGATTIPSFDQVLEDQLHDGLAHSGMGFRTSVASLPVTLTVDLAGDAPIPVAGTMLDPQAADGLQGDMPRDFTLLLSTDGASWTPALSGQLSTLTGDQAFVLPEPIEATHARLRIDSVHGGGFGQVALGEWKVVAVPGSAPAGLPVDLAQPSRGGHVAWFEPGQGDPHLGGGLLSEDPTPQQLWLDGSTPVSWAVGFRDDRAAQLTALEWVDPQPSDPDGRLRRVDVAISLDGPAGPWRELDSWELERAADGSVAPYAFPEPTWARFVRFSGVAPKSTSTLELPSTMRAIERPIDPSYRSALGEWGPGSPDGPYEWLEPPDVSPAPGVVDDNDTPETADPLPAGSTTSGRVDGGTDLDWYTFTVPEGQNSMSIEVEGKPIVAVALTLVDGDGFEVPMLFGAGEEPGTVVYQAEVSPGATYRLMVEQPPSSIVFSFDTSGSMGSYLEYVYQGLRAFTADVVPGEEAVRIIPFEEDPLLDEWSDQPYELQNAVDRYLQSGGSSSAEAALITATTELSAREGARAILIVTDAETSSFDRSAELWRTLASVRPLIFSVHVGATGEPFLSRTYMQDWARVAGGFYQYTRSHGEMDRAFDRLATWLRRPAGYDLALSTSFREKPPPSREPGTITVGSPGDGSLATISPDVGVEIILDTSGSMLQEIRGKRRIDLARDVLADLLEERLPDGAPVAVRVLGDRADVCGTRLVVPLGPLDAGSVIRAIEGIRVDAEADTPLAAALAAVPGDLGDSPGTRIVLLITDSEEVWPHPDLCGADPVAAIRDLRRRGIDARLNIVGLTVDARKAKAQLRRWARVGNGTFFEARDAEQLGRSIRMAVSAPFRVLDERGNEVASGTVDGGPVPIEPGTYSIVVLGEPVVRFDGIVVEPKGSVALTLPEPAPEPTPEPMPETDPEPDPESIPEPETDPPG